MKHKVSELEGALLDAAVSKAHGYKYDVRHDELLQKQLVMALDAEGQPWFPAEHWAHGGPIIERQHITLRSRRDEVRWLDWAAFVGDDPTGAVTCWGPTPLIAAMRAYAASKFGEFVEL